MIECLVDVGGASVDPENDWNSTPLFWACNNAHDNAAKLLIGKGACIKKVNHNGWNVLHACCRSVQQLQWSAW